MEDEENPKIRILQSDREDGLLKIDYKLVLS